MGSNLVLEKGTALSNTCVFSSLRQDLVRRLYNTDLEVEMQTRKLIIEDFIQRMVNSGHKYQFIKAVVLQGISKFVYMVQRSKLDPTDKRYAPVHRERSYKWKERLLLKYTNKDNWYTGISLKDQYRNVWKSWIRRKGDRRVFNKKCRKDGLKPTSQRKGQRIPVTTAIFVPPTRGGVLTQMIQLKENQMSTPWSVKVLEKPGIPLFRTFQKNFKMKDGCYRGMKCVCEGSGSGCNAKRVVYQAVCEKCKGLGEEMSYIGETARQFGERTNEHLSKAEKFSKTSFIIDHWMEQHHLDTSPPKFKFTVLSGHRDPLSRQLKEAVMIGNAGNLNKKNEFGLNELIRLDAPRYSWDKSLQDKNDQKERCARENKLNDFVAVMCKVSKVSCVKKAGNVHNNGDFDYRQYKRKACRQAYSVCDLVDNPGLNKKLRMMATSTPKDHRVSQQISSDDSAQADNTGSSLNDTE